MISRAIQKAAIHSPADLGQIPRCNPSSAGVKKALL